MNLASECKQSKYRSKKMEKIKMTWFFLSRNHGLHWQSSQQKFHQGRSPRRVPNSWMVREGLGEEIQHLPSLGEGGGIMPKVNIQSLGKTPFFWFSTLNSDFWWIHWSTYEGNPDMPVCESSKRQVWALVWCPSLSPLQQTSRRPSSCSFQTRAPLFSFDSLLLEVGLVLSALWREHLQRPLWLQEKQQQQ